MPSVRAWRVGLFAQPFKNVIRAPLLTAFYIILIVEQAFLDETCQKSRFFPLKNLIFSPKKPKLATSAHTVLLVLPLSITFSDATNPPADSCCTPNYAFLSKISLDQNQCSVALHCPSASSSPQKHTPRDSEHSTSPCSTPSVPPSRDDFDNPSRESLPV
jgi:hypothetical protein